MSQVKSIAARRSSSFWRTELSRGRMLKIALSSIAVLILVWFLITLPGGIPQLKLPSPQSVVLAFVKMTVDPYLGNALLGHILASLSIVLGGWLLGGIVGVPLGIAIAWWKRARWILFPIFQMFRPVPPLAWIPIAIVWLGIGPSARIFVVFIAALIPWVMNSIQAVDSVDGILIRAARTLGAGDSLILRRVVIRTALPTIVAGARVALGNAWTTLIAAEMLGAAAGLGFVALSSARTLDTDILLVSMVVIGILGALFSFGMRSLTRLVAPWSKDA